MNICVFCSSSNSIDNNYKKSAFALGKSIAKRGDTLVYGGATGGLMDAVAEGAKIGNGNIIGVIPEAIIRNNRLSSIPTILVQTANMAERKKKMQEIADIFIVLPGNYGTLDEMFSVVASGLVGEHNKPLLCVNENHFYESLIAQIEFMQVQCSTAKKQDYKPIFVQSVKECINKIDKI
ncbi:MAG: TIGR00730 family Rossman fold protein [Paludibacteraceae bacterium]